jgi:predicted nucleic acid-binding protein
MIHLDTGFLIRAMVATTVEGTQLQDWVRRGETVRLSAMSWVEFLCGPIEAQEIEAAGLVLGEPVPLAGPEAAVAARLFVACGRRRGSLADCMIAATAIRAGALLATTDHQDFERFEGHGLRLAWPPRT